MAFDLVPGPFWRMPSVFDDEDFPPLARQGSGLQVSEDDEHVFVEAAFPGVPPERISVEFEHGVLTLGGEVEEREEDKNRHYHRRAQSSFRYQVAVPGSVDETAEPTAVAKEGKLTVTFSKKTPAKPSAKRIPVRSK